MRCLIAVTVVLAALFVDGEEAELQVGADGGEAEVLRLEDGGAVAAVGELLQEVCE